jgi:hypothetical protein
MLRRLALLTTFAIGVTSCSSDPATDPATPKANERVGDIPKGKTDVWKDGYKLTGLIRIFEGATVEIEPGAKITCSNSVQIQVGGMLKVKSSGKRATITCPRWRGILVAGNGELDITGLDIDNAEVGIETTRGAGAVNVAEMNITTTARPFLVREESKITATKVTATTPTTLQDFEVSVTEVFGTFIAKYLSYEANTNEGIMVMRGGVAEIEDSTLTAKNGLDLISSYGGKSLKVRYTTMKGAHCGVHLGESKDDRKEMTGSLEVDHVTSEGNIFGITIYAASTTGPHVVKDSNFQGANSWIDLKGDHGPIAFQNVFWACGGGAPTCETLDPRYTPADVPVFNRATARIDTAKPR